MITNFFSPAHHILVSAILVILKDKCYVVVVNSIWISNALLYRVPEDTNHTQIQMKKRSFFVLNLKMIIIMYMIVIFVEKNEFEIIGSTILYMAVI
jgi:hypothetical protein